MKDIARLQTLYFHNRMGTPSWNACIDWAIERLSNNEEEGDLDVVMLAAATREEEVNPLVEEIIKRHIGLGALSDEMAAGKYIVELRAAYTAQAETAITLEPKLWRLYYKLGHPTWLTMLARNCEYATDVDAFEKPFEDEFEYISKLWSEAQSLEEFLAEYDHKVSLSHDAL